MSDSTPLPLLIVRDPAQAESLLDAQRRQILRVLRTPGSSSSVADELGLPRQRLNYHVRALEDQGLLAHVEDRRKGNCVERVVQARAEEYLIDPAILGEPAPSDTEGDIRVSFFTEDLVNASSRTLSQVADLLEGDPSQASRLPTLSVETQIRFRSPQDELEFSKSLRGVLEQMARRYHQSTEGDGRLFRITVGGHLSPHS